MRRWEQGAGGQTNWFQLYSTQIQVISCEIRTIATPLFIWIEHSNENETFNWQFKVVESNQKFYRSLKSVFKKTERTEHAQRLHFLSKVFVPSKKCLNCLQPWILVMATCFLTHGDGEYGDLGASVKDELRSLSVESVMMTPDSRLSCKNIYDPGSHSEMRAAQKYSFLKTDESLWQRYRVIEQFYFHV